MNDVHAYEKVKYDTVWACSAYHAHSPGVAAISRIVAALETDKLTYQHGAVTHVLDAGCGSGVTALELAQRNRALSIHGVDISMTMATKNVMRFDVHKLTLKYAKNIGAVHLYEQPLDELPTVVGLDEDYDLNCSLGYCIDVMEHIPPQLVDRTLRAISRTVSGKMYFEIAGYADHYGPAIVGEPLHLTIMKADEWVCHMFRHWASVHSSILDDGQTWAITCERPWKTAG